MAKSYEIVADEVTILKQTGELIDPLTGRSLGVQQGAGRIYLKGEVVPEALVSPLMIEALNDEDHPGHEAAAKRIKEVSDDPRENAELRLGIPFAGYEDMDEDEILAALQVLPSSTVQAVKAYESGQDDPREKIVNYSIGFGQDPAARQEGRVGSTLDEEARDEADKPVTKLTTREVPEEGVVQVGDGITGTGDPDIPHGSRADEDEEKPKPRRRSRRTRPQAKDEGEGEGGSDE